MSFFDFSYFYLIYLKSKKTFFVFHSDFGCLDEGFVEALHPLIVYFQPHHKYKTGKKSFTPGKMAAGNHTFLPAL